MIESTKAYKVGDKTFGTLEEAQQFELGALLEDTPIENVPEFLLAHGDQVIDILTTGPRSRPKARKANGATRKPRQPKTEVTT